MNFENILFIDIETVSQYKNYEDMPEDYKYVWNKKYERNEYLNALNVSEAYENKAAIFAEYGKIICISVGYYHKVNDEYRIKSFADHDENILLEKFKLFCQNLKNMTTQRSVVCSTWR